MHKHFNFTNKQKNLTSRYKLSRYNTKMLQLRRLAHKKSSRFDLFPPKLLHKKQKTPSYMYIAEERGADLINRAIEPFMQRTLCDTALEFNPGIKLFTRKLLDRESKLKKIILIEQLEHFMPQLEELHALYPERVKVKQGDMINLWKLGYQDKMDGGTRVPDLLQDVPKRAYEEDPNMLMFGAVGAYNFFKCLINSLVFQNSLFSWGRCEMYLVVPPPIYIHLTCSSEIGHMLYRSTSMLFQIMFEYRFITQLPREYFLPYQSGYTITKGSKLSRVKSINPEYLYLVRIVPRRELYELCPAADMPALWYFIKQNCISRRNRIIPNLEKWVPACGPRLIINTDTKKPVQPLYADEDEKMLPQYSKRCTTMSCQDYFPKMNIFTQFGDLSPSQMLTLFTQFRRWPEYEESSFLASLESSLLKMESAADENIDDIGLREEDDVGSDISLLAGVPTDELEEISTKDPTVKPAAKRKRKVKANC